MPPTTAPTDRATAGVTPAESTAPLLRHVGLGGAVLLGLGSILGTGVFVSIGTAAGVVGPAVVLATVIAAGVAACNALSSAQLAAAHPVSGGTYEYGYRLLSPALGFTAGWTFLLAKSASAATAALGFAGYALNLFGASTVAARVAVGVAAVVAVTAVVVGGIRRSNAANAAIVGLTLLALAAFVAAGLPTALRRGAANFSPFFEPTGGGSGDAAGGGAVGGGAVGGGVAPLLHATALMFVAFTGYGRIATLGEEVVEPRRTIPRAIVLTLFASTAVYVAVAAVAVGSAGADGLASATGGRAAPLEAVARGFGVPGVRWVVAAGAITAMLGVLLNLVLGLSRVWLAMGRRGDMPARLAGVSTGGTPVAATVLAGAVVAGIALVGDVRATWAFSAFTVLVYYAITNAAALRLPSADRFYPRAAAWAGLAACAGLAWWVPWRVWATGVSLVALGLAWHGIARRGARRAELRRR